MFASLKETIQESALLSRVNFLDAPFWGAWFYILTLVFMMTGHGVAAAVLTWAVSHVLFYVRAIAEGRISKRVRRISGLRRWLWLVFKSCFSLKTADWGFVLLDIFLFPPVIYLLTRFVAVYHVSLPLWVLGMNLVVGWVCGVLFHLNDTRVYDAADELESVWSLTKRGHDLVTVPVIVALMLDGICLLAQHFWTWYSWLILAVLVVYPLVEFVAGQVIRRRLFGDPVPFGHPASHPRTGHALRRR